MNIRRRPRLAVVGVLRHPSGLRIILRRQGIRRMIRRSEFTISLPESIVEKLAQS
jgi:hypothetical protein